MKSHSDDVMKRRTMARLWQKGDAFLLRLTLDVLASKGLADVQRLCFLRCFALVHLTSNVMLILCSHSHCSGRCVFVST